MSNGLGEGASTRARGAGGEFNLVKESDYPQNRWWVLGVTAYPNVRLYGARSPEITRLSPMAPFVANHA